MPVRVAVYGSNGHQIADAAASHENARLTAVAEYPLNRLPASVADSVRVYGSLEEILEDPEVDLVSLCSPWRRDQALQAVRALQAGKHVYAEKPCAMSEEELDAIVQTADESGRIFREMAGTAFGQPYLAMRRVVREGRIGEVVQVIAEKSYPYHPDRPQDEEIDGGLICQNAVHAIRMVEQVACVRIRGLQAAETTTGNPKPGGGLRMASSMIFHLENGGLASVSANYLNPPGTGSWGYEMLRILGTRGMVESTQGGAHTRLVVGETDLGALPVSEPGLDYLDALLKTILGQGSMPTTLEEELSPTRWAIRAKRAASRH